MNKIDFLAEIKSTSQTKKASLDNEYKVTFVTDDSNILELGKLPSDIIVKVTVKLDNA